MTKQLLVEDYIRRNKRETVLICFAMILLLFGVIFAIGIALGFPPIYAVAIGLPIAFLYISITYSFSVQSVIAAAKARPVNLQKREEKILMYMKIVWL